MSDSFVLEFVIAAVLHFSFFISGSCIQHTEVFKRLPCVLFIFLHQKEFSTMFSFPIS